MIIGEVWEDASNKTAYDERRKYFMGKELDSVMNYPMRDAIINAILLKIDARELDARLMSLKENYPEPAYYSLLNIMSSHDVERVMTLMSGAPTRHEVDRNYQAQFSIEGFALDLAIERATLALGLQMMLPGVPCVYYGDEIGMQGYGDPFCRRTFPWDNMNKYDPSGRVNQRYKKMIHLRNSSDAFSIGKYDSVYKEGQVYAFMRRTDDEKFLVMANMGLNQEYVRIDIARYKPNKLVAVAGGDEVLETQDGIFIIGMSRVSLKVYRVE